QAAGGGGYCEGAEAVGGGGRGGQGDDGDRRVAAGAVRGQQGGGGGAQGDRAARAEQGVGDGGGSQFHDELRRRGIHAARERPAGGRGDAGVTDPGAEGSGSDPEGGDGAPGAPQGGAVAEHAGEHVRAAGDGPVLPDLREGDPELRGEGVAGERLRRGARVPGADDGLLRDPDPDEGRGGARQAGPDDPEGRDGAAVLPGGNDVRAGEPFASAGRLRLRRRAEVRGGR